MTDIQVSKRASEAAGEEQTDKRRKTVRLEQEALSAAVSSDPTVALEYLASGETKSAGVRTCAEVRPCFRRRANYCVGSILRKGWRKSRYIGEVFEWYRGEDAGDLKRSALNELVGNWTCLNALEKNLEK